MVLSLEVIDTAKELFAITCERFIDVDFIVACSSETHCGLYGRKLLILGNLSDDVLEQRTSTGSGPFLFLDDCFA